MVDTEQTCPFSLGELCKHVQATTAQHKKDLRKLARYFAGTLDGELTLVPSQTQRMCIDLYTDGDWDNQIGAAHPEPV